MNDTPEEPAKIDFKMLEALVCPVTGAALKYNRATQELISLKARLAYPIHNGVPIMLPDSARELTDSDM